MLQNAYFLAKIGADTAENEQHFAKFCRSAVVSPGPARHYGPGPDEAAVAEYWAAEATARRDAEAREAFLRAEREVADYVFSNFYSNFWLIFGKL